uniref:Uncharacterized protein n=1 Tax=Macaca nemestrina TaxID=9545 RepID=A0A2K6DN00_MACNE
MAGFLDNFHWPEYECIDWGERRNAVASVVTGILFFTAVVYRRPEQLNHAFHTCGVFPTLAFFIIKMLYPMLRTGAWVWLFIGFVSMFGVLIASMWILFGAYVTQPL